MVQVILQGSTSRCLPPEMTRTSKKFVDWLWEFSENHWSNLARQKQYLARVIAKYFRKKIAKLGLPAQQKCVYLIDCWPVHISAEFRRWMKENYPWVLDLYVPPSCTSKFQPQDKGYQRPFKHGFKLAFLAYQQKMFKRAKASGVNLCT